MAGWRRFELLTFVRLSASLMLDVFTNTLNLNQEEHLDFQGTDLL